MTGEKPAAEIIDDATMEKTYNPDFTGCYCVLKYGPSGMLLDKLTFQYISPSSAPVRSMAVAKDGRIFINTATEYLILDGEGTLLYSNFDEQLQIFGLQLCDRGIIGSVFNNGPDHNGFGTILLDGDGTYTFLEGPEGSLSICQSAEMKSIFNDGAILYSYDFDARERIDILTWNYGSMTANGCTMVLHLGGRSFACLKKDSESLYLISSVASPKREKSDTVQVASIGAALWMKELVELNCSDSEYYYEYTEYPVEQTERLLAEIISGNGPDLLLFNGNIDTSSQYFEDLYEYIDRDPDIERSSFIPNLLNALEIKGELH